MIREIFNAITPENIRTNPLYVDFIEVFIQTLEEKSKYSINMNDIFKNPDPLVRTQFLKMYLNDFYEIFQTITSTNMNGDSQFDYTNDIMPDINEIFNDEYFQSAKAFKENKGTSVAIEYVYNVLERINTGAISGTLTPFNLTESKDNGFYFEVEGNVSADVYDQIVKPLSHPAGYAYKYTQILSDFFQDLFSAYFDYSHTDVLKVVCNLGAYEYDFIAKNYTVKTLEEYDIDYNKATKVTLNDNSYVLQINYPTYSDIKWYNSADVLLKDFSHDEFGEFRTCGIEISAPIVRSLIDDTVLVEIEENTAYDNFWVDVDNIVKIAQTNLVIGGFKVGQGFTRYVLEDLGFIFKDQYDGNPIINETLLVGGFYIGGVLEEPVAPEGYVTPDVNGDPSY